MFANPSKKVPCGDIEVNVRFLVPASVIYEALTSTQAAQVFYFLHCFTQYYTQSPCSIEPKEGGNYFVYDGSIQGQFISAVFLVCHYKEQSSKKIEMKWRRREWEEGVYSTVEIQFIEVDNAVTELHLVQRNVPKYDCYNNGGVLTSVENGWKEMIFRRISMIMGYVFQTEDEFEQTVF